MDFMSWLKIAGVVKDNWRPLSVALFAIVIFVLFLPMMLTALFIPTADIEYIKEYQAVGEQLGVPWTDMVTVDMVTRDNNFENITNKDILLSGLSFMTLTVTEIVETTTFVEKEIVEKGVRVKRKVPVVSTSEDLYTVIGTNIFYFIQDKGLSNSTATDIMTSIASLHNRDDFNIRIDYFGLEDLIASLPEDKQEWAWNIYSSNMMQQVFGESFALPEQIVTNYTGFFAWPVPGYGRLSDAYGWRIHPTLLVKKFHHGIDIPAPTGTPIISTAPGTVQMISYSTGSTGYFVRISHTDENGASWLTTYMHMSQINVKSGDKIERGDVIGAVGSTGRSTGPHLHYEVKYNGNTIDPMRLYATRK